MSNIQPIDLASSGARDALMSWRRVAGVIAGLATHVLFGITVWYLFAFLSGARGHALWPGLLLDVALALQFAIPHSVLLHRVTRQFLGRWISPAFYGLFFCFATCVSLLITIGFWQTSAIVLWEFTGLAYVAMVVAFGLSWVALLYSLNLTGLGYQTGLTPWLAWVRGQRQRQRSFVERGLYRYFRHPIYLSFLGLIWFTPRMTLDHALLTSIWTVYIFYGSWLKDRRLEFYLGPLYLEYESRVPGYPGLYWGPLGLRSSLSNASSSLSNATTSLSTPRPAGN